MELNEIKERITKRITELNNELILEHGEQFKQEEEYHLMKAAHKVMVTDGEGDDIIKDNDVNENNIDAFVEWFIGELVTFYAHAINCKHCEHLKECQEKNSPIPKIMEAYHESYATIKG